MLVYRNEVCSAQSTCECTVRVSEWVWLHCNTFLKRVQCGLVPRAKKNKKQKRRKRRDRSWSTKYSAKDNFGFGLWLNFLFIMSATEMKLAEIFALCWCRKDGYKVKETWSSEQWMKELHFTLSLIRGLIRAANDTWLNVCMCVFVEANLSHFATVQKRTWFRGDDTQSNRSK